MYVGYLNKVKIWTTILWNNQNFKIITLFIEIKQAPCNIQSRQEKKIQMKFT